MRTLLLKRLVIIIPYLLAITALSFSVVYFAPGESTAMIILKYKTDIFITEEQAEQYAAEHNLNLPFKEDIKRADKDNAIDVYIGDNSVEELLSDGMWEHVFTKKPEAFTQEEKKRWLSGLNGVSLGSDAFFPFSDNIERARRSGVEFIAQPGGSVRDEVVIECCNKYGISMAFTGIRLFHH